MDVMELKFMCKTDHKIEDKMQFLHFKSSNPDLVKVAMIGD